MFQSQGLWLPSFFRRLNPLREGAVRLCLGQVKERAERLRVPREGRKVGSRNKFLPGALPWEGMQAAGLWEARRDLGFCGSRLQGGREGTWGDLALHQAVCGERVAEIRASGAVAAAAAVRDLEGTLASLFPFLLLRKFPAPRVSAVGADREG